MKKNITINMFGSLYAIDEDAYELLKKYQENMRNYFRRQEGGEEIADDIEHRIAELLTEMKKQGAEAVTIEHIEQIIQRIGNPEELGDATEDTRDNQEEPPEWKESKQAKKLFRNPDDQMLSGLLSGMSNYFGGDVLLWRISFIVLCILTSFTPVIVYLILWAITPLAITPEDRLKMRGKAVNPNNLAEEIMNGAKRASEYIRDPQTQNHARGCLMTILSLITKLFKGFLILLAILIMLSLLISLIFIIVIICAALFGIADDFTSFQHIGMFDSEQIIALNKASYGTVISFWISVVSGLLVIGIPLYGGAHFIGHMTGRFQPMSAKQRFFNIIFWIICACICFVSTAFTSSRIDQTYQEEKIRKNTHNGFYVPEWEWDYLQNNGWNIVKHENGGKQYINSGEYYDSENNNEDYLDGCNHDGILKYQMERKVTVQPGLYRLEAAVRASGDGAFIYVNLYQEGKKFFRNIPNTGNEGGTIWQEAKKALEADSTLTGKVRNIAEANDGIGYGWHKVIIDSIRVTDGYVTYGVSNDPAFTGQTWNGGWLSATDFNFTRIGNLSTKKH